MDNNAAKGFTNKHITDKQGSFNDVSFVFGIFHAGAPAKPLEFFKRAAFSYFFWQGVRPLQKIRRVFKHETERPCAERHQQPYFTVVRKDSFLWLLDVAGHCWCIVWFEIAPESKWSRPSEWERIFG